MHQKYRFGHFGFSEYALTRPVMYWPSGYCRVALSQVAVDQFGALIYTVLEEYNRQIEVRPSCVALHVIRRL